jgi:hypothetical protein
MTGQHEGGERTSRTRPCAGELHPGQRVCRHGAQHQVETDRDAAQQQRVDQNLGSGIVFQTVEVASDGARGSTAAEPEALPDVRSAIPSSQQREGGEDRQRQEQRVADGDARPIR